MAKQKRHHYIPRFYLEGFTNEEDSQLSLYRGDRAFKSTPERTGFQNNLYTLEGIPEDFIEQRFTEVENDAAAIFRTISEHTFPSTGDKEKLSTFISLLASRVPSRIENIHLQMTQVGNRMFEQSIKHDEARQKEICQAIELNWEDKKDREELEKLLDNFNFSPPQKTALAFVFLGEELAKYLAKMRWQFFINETNTDFITTDDPFLVTTSIDSELGVGIGFRDAVLFFPISKKILLVASWGTHTQDFYPITRNQVLAVNKEFVIQSYDQVYASNHNDALHNIVKQYQNICLAPAIDIVQAPEEKAEYIISRIKLVEYEEGYDPKNYKLFNERVTHRLPSKLQSFLNARPR